VYDEVAFGLRLLNITHEEIDERTMNMLEQFGLKEFVNEHPLNLSMGQKRRLSVATMLILEPRMIIFDEPMTGQDKRRTDFIIQMIKKLRNQGTTAIFITHDMRFVADISSRVVVLNQGKLSFQGTPEKLFNTPEILHQNSLTDPAVHRIALKYSRNYGDRTSSVITVQQFCDRMEIKQ
jgi:energy-coupling factor transport system ATP-binding protein